MELKQTPNLQEMAVDSLWPVGKRRCSPRAQQSGETEAGQAAWGHLREPEPKIRGLPPVSDLAGEKLLAAVVRNTMGSFSARNAKMHLGGGGHLAPHVPGDFP